MMKQNWLCCSLMLCLTAIGAAAQGSPQWRGLAPGPHAVGYKLVERVDHSRMVRPKTNFEGQSVTGQAATGVRIALWYPATRGATAPMIYEDYLLLTRPRERIANDLKMFAQIALGRQLTDDEVSTVRGTRTAAIRDAAPLAGPFPLLIAGSDGSITSNTILFEYLASHGYVVAVTPSLPHTATRQALNPALAVDERMHNLEYLFDYAREIPFADVRRLGVIGVNFDGIAAVGFAIRQMWADAVVSIDGWEGKGSNAKLLRDLPDFDVRRMRAPYLLVLQDEGNPPPSLRPDLSLFDDFKYSDRHYYMIYGLSHAYLVGNALALPVAPDRVAGYEFLFRRVREFLDVYVKKESQASGSWRESPPGNLLKAVRVEKGLSAVPIDEEWEELLGARFDQGPNAGDIDKAIEVFRRAKRDNPEVVLFREATLNLFAFRFLRQNRVADAIALYRLNMEAYPLSTRARINLAQALRQNNGREEAVAVLEKALELVGRDPSLPEAQRQSLRTQIEGQLQDLKTK